MLAALTIWAQWTCLVAWGGGPPSLPTYVGRSVCGDCHGPTSRALPCKVPPKPPHAGAFDVLSHPEAAEIVAISGIPEAPTSSRVCLGCHSTGADEGPRWWAETFDRAAGVQCEACHGAGSRHVTAMTALTPKSPKPAGSRMHVPTRAVCESCHRRKSSHRLVLGEKYRRSPLNKDYKTPVHMAVSDDGRHLFVVCRHSDSLMIVDAAAGTVLAEVSIGRRPDSLAASPDGKTIYVSNRLDDTLSVIDIARREVVRTVRVGDEPHGVAVAPDGRRIFVANAGDDSVSVVDAERLVEVRRLAAGRGAWSVALTPSGDELLVTSVRPDFQAFRRPHSSEVTVIDVDAARVARRLSAGGTNMVKGIAVVPAGPHKGVALFAMMRSKDLVPATRLAQGWMITNGLGVIRPDGRVDQVLLDLPHEFFADPADVAVSPDGRTALVTSGGSDRVAVVDIDALMRTIDSMTTRERTEVLPNHLGMSDRFITRRAAVGRNPRGVTFSPDGRFAYVADALDDKITVLDATDFTISRRIDLGGPARITELRKGERLFHSAAKAFAGQFSCQSCHPDGHTSGLTVDIEADGIGVLPVDNRTLRGIFDTDPFKWEGTNPSLFRQCGPRLAVFFTRCEPFSPDELQALVRYECTIERPPNRFRSAEGLTASQYRGKLIFERAVDNQGKPIEPRIRCITCHSGPYRTSQTRSDVETAMWLDADLGIPPTDENIADAAEFGNLGLFVFADTGVASEEFDAPHLTNIYDSPPYLHNGAARTLEEIWTKYGMLGAHGHVADLTRSQFNDLMAYLRAL